jgi:hypothetical protein
MSALSIAHQWMKQAEFNQRLDQEFVSNVREMMMLGHTGYALDRDLEKIEIPTSNALTQYVYLATMMAIAMDNGRPRMPELADDILHRQADNLKKYKARTYLLSDKQVNIILRDVLVYRREGTEDAN